MKLFIKGVLLLLWMPALSFAQTTVSSRPVQVMNVNSTPAIKSIKLSNNVRLQYVEQGDARGIPVIFLHGYTDSWHSFETVLPHLPENVHAFVLSQRGHGDSDRPETGYNPKDFAADVALFMKQQKMNGAVIVGHSLGGLVAQRFALDHPKLCRGLVIVSSAASFADNAGVPEFLDMVEQLQDPVDKTFAEEFQKSTIAKPIDPAYFTALVGESMKLPARVWKSVARELRHVNYVAELKTIKQPVLILWGDKDLFCLKDDQDQFQQHIRGARVLVYEGIGHALHWEEPERFANDLLKFIIDL
ncbi:MAG: alpha/beta hydrolase [Chitinophagaceae bacterium]